MKGNTCVSVAFVYRSFYSYLMLPRADQCSSIVFDCSCVLNWYPHLPSRKTVLYVAKYLVFSIYVAEYLVFGILIIHVVNHLNFSIYVAEYLVLSLGCNVSSLVNLCCKGFRLLDLCGKSLDFSTYIAEYLVFLIYVENYIIISIYVAKYWSSNFLNLCM